MGTREIVALALKLDPTERFKLVEEAEQRLAAYRTGRVKGIPAEDILGPL